MSECHDHEFFAELEAERCVSATASNAIDALQAENKRLREFVEWIAKRGGLGLDVYNRAAEILGRPQI